MRVQRNVAKERLIKGSIWLGNRISFLVGARCQVGSRFWGHSAMTISRLADPPDDHLPAIIEPPITPTLPGTSSGTYIVPALITNARGDQPGWRYIEFFTANINNDHTQRAYARALQPVFRPVAKIAGYRSPPFGRSMWRRW